MAGFIVVKKRVIYHLVNLIQLKKENIIEERKINVEKVEDVR